MNSNQFNETGKTGRKTKTYKQGFVLIASLAGLLLLVSVFEALRYFAPLAFETGNTIREQALPDGSTVMLNTNSKLSLGSDWKKDEDREAWLNGEAFFHVRKVADTNGFAIHTSRFDVVAFQADLNVLNRKDTVQAWLQNGTAFILSHDSKPKKILISPGDLVEYTGNQIITTHHEGSGITAWKNKIQ